MAFWNKQGLSSKHADHVDDYLHKAHKIDRELFKNLHDRLAIIDEIGIDDADEEFAHIRSLAPKLKQLADVEENHQLPKKDQRQAQNELIQFERSLASLLVKSREQLLDKGAAEKWITSVDEILGRLEHLLTDKLAA